MLHIIIEQKVEQALNIYRAHYGGMNGILVVARVHNRSENNCVKYHVANI